MSPAAQKNFHQFHMLEKPFTQMWIFKKSKIDSSKNNDFLLTSASSMRVYISEPTSHCFMIFAEF